MLKGRGRWVRFIAVLGVLAMIAAACGDDDDSGGGFEALTRAEKRHMSGTWNGAEIENPTESTENMVEPNGIEPSTSALRTRRSPS